MATNRTRPICLPSILLPMLLVVVLLLLDTTLCADAQPPAPTDDDMFGTYSTDSSSSTAVLIAFLICAFFFVGVFSVYFHRCAGNSSAISASSARGAVGRAAGRGLDPAMLESFPTMEYAAVKKVKGGQFGTLECAVCMAEFLEDDTLRLLPKCRHVFHPDCIDAWLASHVTCPVCRSNLANAEEVAATTDGGAPVPPDHVEIDIEVEDRGPDEADLELTARPKPPPETFRRWHSERRSAEGGQDRHTLRLPEHVQRELAAPGSFRRSQSMTGYPDGGEAGSRKGIRGGGGRSGRMGRSEPWMSFLRVFPVAGDRLDGAVRAGGVDSGSTTDGDKSSCTAGVEPV